MVNSVNVEVVGMPHTISNGDDDWEGGGMGWLKKKLTINVKKKCTEK